MAGMNEHYHLSLGSELKSKLKQKAHEKGIPLSHFIRQMFLEKTKEYNFEDSLKRIEEKLDKLLKK